MTRKTTKVRGRPARTRIPRPILALLALLILAIGYRLAAPRLAHAGHPTPRADVTADGVVPSERYASDAVVARVYAMAREIPHILDGIHCYCDCSKHSGHYSLLTCFESDHGAGCDICLREAAMAYQMSQQGRSLDEIRAQIDAEFGG